MASVKDETSCEENTTTWTVLLGHFLPNVSIDKNVKESVCLSGLSQASLSMANRLHETAQEGLSAIVQNGVIPRIFLITNGLEARSPVCDLERGIEESDSTEGNHVIEQVCTEEGNTSEDLATRVKNILSNSAKEVVDRSGVLENMTMWTWGTSLSKWLTNVLDQSVHGITHLPVRDSETAGESLDTLSNASISLEMEEHTASPNELSDAPTKSTELPGYIIIVENCVAGYINQTKDFISQTVDSVKTKLADSRNSVIELGNNTVQSLVQLISLQTFKDTLSTYSFMEGLQAFSDYLVDVPDLFQEPDAHALNRNDELDLGLLHHEEIKPKVHVVYIGRR